MSRTRRIYNRKSILGIYHPWKQMCVAPTEVWGRLHIANRRIVLRDISESRRTNNKKHLRYLIRNEV